MLGWIILGVLLALILLILLIPVGVDLGNEGGAFHLSAKLGPMLLQLFPKQPGADKPEKQDKKKKKKKKAEEPGEEEEKKPKKKRELPISREDIPDLLRLLGATIRRFGRAWHIDRFLLHTVIAGSDPYDTAVTYGELNAALSALAPVCRRHVRVKDCSVWTDVDFLADKLFLEFGLAMTINLWRILGVVNRLAFGALRIVLRRKRLRKKEAKALKKAAASQVPPTENENQENKNTENVQEEERMAANG